MSDRDATPPLIDERMAIEEAEMGLAPQAIETQSADFRDQIHPIVALSAGGFLGAITRYALGIWITDRWGNAFPWGTLAINVTGSFVLGFYLSLVSARGRGSTAGRLFVATGFLGAYTTFSTFSNETVGFIRDGHVGRALAYIGASLVLGLAASLAGVRTGMSFGGE